MGRIDLKDLVLNNYKESSKEAVYNSHFPSLVDGTRPVNRAVLLSLKDLTRGTTSLVSPSSVLSNAYDKYHLHKTEGIYKSIGFMSRSRLPLVTAKTNNGTVGMYDIDDGFYISQRYITIALTQIGAEFVNSTILSPTIRNYDDTCSMPEVFLSLLPNILFQTYWDITGGISTINISLCPAEVFKAMKVLLNTNFKATFKELADCIKGFDTEEYHTHITTAQNLYSLIEEGDSNTSILIPISIDKNRIVIKGSPLGRSFSDIAESINTLNTNRLSSKLKDKTLVNFAIDKVEKSYKNIIIHYRPLKDATISDIRSELYEKTDLIREYRVEYIGILPSKVGDKEVNRRLHKSSVREIMTQCLKNGYNNRIKEIQNEIDALNNSKVQNELFEKITRPSTLVWFKSILDMPNKKEILFHLANNGDTNGLIKSILKRDVNTKIEDSTIGDLFIKGGLTRQDVEIVFQKKSGSILARLDERSQALYDLKSYAFQLANLNKQLEDSNIKAYLNATLDRWISMPISARRSPIIYKDNNLSIKELKQDLIQNKSYVSKMQIQNIYLIEYEGATFEFKLSLQGLNMEIVKKISIYDRLSELYIITEEHIHRILSTKVELDTPVVYNTSEYRGHFILTPKKVYLFVTNRGRIKLIHYDKLVQNREKTLGFNLIELEKIITTLEFDENTDFTKLAIEVLTVDGIKRLDLSNTAMGNKKSWRQMFSNRPTNVIDARVIDKDLTNAFCYTTDGYKFIEYKAIDVYKRNVSKEHLLAEDFDFICFLDHKLLTIDNKIINGNVQNIEKVLSKSANNVAYTGNTINTDINIISDLIDSYILEYSKDNTLHHYLRPIYRG